MRGYVAFTKNINMTYRQQTEALVWCARLVFCSSPGFKVMSSSELGGYFWIKLPAIADL